MLLLKNERKLEQMFLAQYNLQNFMNNHIYTQEYRNMMFLAIIDEVCEAMRETPWKSWKKNQKLNINEFQEEIVDIWHFLINLSISAGLTPDILYHKFILKNEKNFKRQNNDY